MCVFLIKCLLFAASGLRKDTFKEVGQYVKIAYIRIPK